jgi:hypothetical protein
MPFPPLKYMFIRPKRNNTMLHLLPGITALTIGPNLPCLPLPLSIRTAMHAGGGAGQKGGKGNYPNYD